MISFRLLGAVELQDAARGDFTDLLRRPRRLAVLSYLAAAHPHGYHRRDKLLGLFWAEATQDHARKSLNQALFVLRKELGRDAVLSRGADEVSLNEELFLVDERCFEEAVRANDYERALDCYRGEFLDGFYISGAPEFEHWADQERTRLREDAIKAAFTLATKYERENNKVAALERARWAVRMAPADEVVFRKLLKLLDRNGEQSAALREYEVFTRRLAEDFGYAASPETQALVEQIRQRKTPRPIDTRPDAAIPDEPFVVPVPEPVVEPPPPPVVRESPLVKRLTRALGDHYSIERELGAGGMAVVFLADDLKNGRKVAIKVLRPEVAEAIGVERFLQEIRIEANLEHPHIVPLYDSGDADGLPYYVMRYYEGESLRQRLRREPQLQPEDAIGIAKDVAEALDFAHNRGVLHRDIKPENILLGEAGAVVCDFGIARALTEAGAVKLTVTQVAIGTPGYMSPEQATAEPQVDGRSDQYSLACVVHEMLAGEALFTGPSARAIIAKHVSVPPTPISTLRPRVPEGMEQALLKALDKSAVDRFATAGEFTLALEHGFSNEPLSVHAPGAHSVTQAGTVPFSRRRRSLTTRPTRLQWLYSAVITGMLALGGVALWRTLFASARAFEERDWILVADFDGPVGDPTLGDAVRELVTVELNQSQFVSAFPRHELNAVMRLASIPDSVRVDVELGRQLAFRSAIRAVLVGNVRAMGSSNYSIALHAVSVDNGHELVSVAGAANDSDLVSRVQVLGEQLRHRLGERREQIEANRALEQVATPSFAAFRAYVDAQELALKGDIEGSTRLLWRAVTLDSAFATAWGMMGLDYVFARQLDSAQFALGQALRWPERLSDAQRYWLEANAAYAIRHDLRDAIRWYDLYLQLRPHSMSGRNNRALYLSSVGRYEDALDELSRAIELSPFGTQLAQIEMLNKTAVLVVLERRADARELAGQLSGPFGQYAELLLATADDNWIVAESLSTPIVEAPTAPSWLRLQAVGSLASALASRGSVVAAQSVLTAAIANAPGATARWYRRASLLLSSAAERMVNRPTAGTLEPPTVGDLVTRGLWYAMAGDTSIARQHLSALRQRDSIEIAQIGNGVEYLTAMIAARGGQWRMVTEILSFAAGHGEHDATNLDPVTSLEMWWLVGVAYERMGILDSAAVQFARVLRPSRMPPGHFALRGLTFPFAHYKLAEIHEKLGDIEEAERHRAVLREVVTAPDPDLRFLLSAPGDDGGGTANYVIRWREDENREF